MYIVNLPDSDIPDEKIFKTNGVIASWLIETCKIPLLGRGKNGEYCFMKTDALINYLMIIPFWFDVTGKFS